MLWCHSYILRAPKAKKTNIKHKNILNIPYKSMYVPLAKFFSVACVVVKKSETLKKYIDI